MRDGQQGHRRKAGAECLRQILHLAEVDQVGGSSRAVYRERSEPRQLSGERVAAGLRADAGTEPDEHVAWRYERRLVRHKVTQAAGGLRGPGARPSLSLRLGNTVVPTMVIDRGGELSSETPMVVPIRA